MATFFKRDGPANRLNEKQTKGVHEKATVSFSALRCGNETRFFITKDKSGVFNKSAEAEIVEAHGGEEVDSGNGEWVVTSRGGERKLTAGKCDTKAHQSPKPVAEPRNLTRGVSCLLKKTALLASSYSPGVYDGTIGEYRGIINYWGVGDTGIVTGKIDEQKTEAMRNRILELVAKLSA